MPGTKSGQVDIYAVNDEGVDKRWAGLRGRHCYTTDVLLMSLHGRSKKEKFLRSQKIFSFLRRNFWEFKRSMPLRFFTTVLCKRMCTWS